jgi:dTDP-4-dehydrorhamnose reductase
MLGQDVMRAGERAGHELVGTTRSELDVTDATSVRDALARACPQAVVNCAAWTDVDGAEDSREQAFAVNVQGADHLARAAAALDLPLLHVSSDYVFSGDAPLDASGKPRAYLESDHTGPRSVYGESKLAGEQRVLCASPRHLVVRASWLFGAGGRNFAATMLNLASARDAVQVVNDQIGCPTWTGFLAPALLGLIDREVAGLLHLAGGGHVSWSGFAQEIFRQAEVDCRVDEVTSAQMTRPAARPAWSALESERGDVLPMPPWEDGLAGYLAARAGVVAT